MGWNVPEGLAGFLKYQICLPMGIQVHPLNYEDSNVHKGHHNHDTLAGLFTFKLFAIN